MFYTMTRLQKEPESYGSVKKLREAGVIHRPELDGTEWKRVEYAGSYRIVQYLGSVNPYSYPCRRVRASDLWCQRWRDVTTHARTGSPCCSHRVPTPLALGPTPTHSQGPPPRLVSMHARTGSRSPCPLARGARLARTHRVPMPTRSRGPHARTHRAMHAGSHRAPTPARSPCTHRAHAHMLACLHARSPCMHASGLCMHAHTGPPMPARLRGPHACAPDPCTRACCIPCCM